MNGIGVNESCYSYINTNRCSVTNAQTGWVYNSNILEGASSVSTTWFLSPNSSDAYEAFVAYSNGKPGCYYNVRNTSAARPVVYLKSNIKIAGGTGEVGSEYTLEAM